MRAGGWWWWGVTDGIVNPGPCAMSRGIKIIPDLALRPGLEASCSAPYPTQKLTRWSIQCKHQAQVTLSSILEATDAGYSGNFRRFMNLGTFVRIFLMRTISSSKPLSGQEGNYGPQVISGETEAQGRPITCPEKLAKPDLRS